MSNSKRPKILVCGDVDGKFKTLFTKVENINTKSGPFDFLLCVGDFFGSSTDSWTPYKDGKLSVPIGTYVLGPSTVSHGALYPDMNGGELAPNVSYLGKRGLFTTSSGLKIAYVSGIETNSKEPPQEHTFVEADVTSVRDICYKGRPSFRGVDILVTSVWPKDIVHINVDLRQTADSWLLSWLATQIKPRYHFCASKTVYYERPPYSNFNSSGDTAVHATRFIALAKVGNEGKQKWLYAANLEPIDKMSAKELYQQTTDQTECPYSGNMLSPHINKKPEEPTQFFYDMNHSDDGDNRRKRSRKNDDGPERKQRPVFDQATCWFCLQSPDVEKHLVISIGDEAYLALAKGGLVPEHLLILPVTHHQSLSDVPEAVAKEIKKFKSALKKYFKTQEKVPVFFERNYKTSHLQMQVVPVHVKLADQLKEMFQECAEAQGFQLDEIPTHSKLEQIAPPGTPYFYVELPSGEKLFHRVKKNFPLQFGREVLASSALLDMEDRADWRDCKISKEEETDLAKQFRNDFKEFDFTV